MKPDDIVYLISKLDKIDNRMDGMSETLVRNTVSLEEHVKRTNLLESKIESDKAEITSQIKPLKVAYDRTIAAIAVVGFALSGLKIAKELGLF